MDKILSIRIQEETVNELDHISTQMRRKDKSYTRNRIIVLLIEKFIKEYEEGT